MSASRGSAAAAGYRLERIHVAEQAYTSFSREPVRETEDPMDRMVHFGWDWRPVAERRFEVVIEVTCQPISVAPESAKVRLFGVFSAEPGVPSVSFRDFIRVNALAILFPFAREVISTMTGRGPYGAFHLHPVNVQSLAEEFDIEATSGAAYLRANPELARSFGLDYRTDRQIATGAEPEK